MSTDGDALGESTRSLPYCAGAELSGGADCISGSTPVEGPYSEWRTLSVAALTSGLNDPSSRFRIRQYIEPLREMAIDVREYVSPMDQYNPLPGWVQRTPRAVRVASHFAHLATVASSRVPDVAATWGCDVTWLRRGLVESLHTLEPFLKRPMVLDIDDAVWLMRPFRRVSGEVAVSRLAQASAMVIAGNAYIADHMSRYTDRIAIVPTAIDTDRFRPCFESRDGGSFVIGWTGSISNAGYLRAVQLPLGAFLRAHPRARLHVVSDWVPDLSEIPSGQLDYTPWTPEVEAVSLRAMDVGIMPLPDDDWTRGKCSFKMLQYMATGLPVVVSPVGMNAEILAQADVGLAPLSGDDWYDAMTQMYQTRLERVRCGAAGRALVVARYGRQVIARGLANVLREAAGVRSACSPNAMGDVTDRSEPIGGGRDWFGRAGG